MESYRDIEGYEGLYKVSNKGRVKSLGNYKSRKEKILKPTDNGWGYLQVILYKNCKRKIHTVHRLVANAFLPNPDKLPQVNHKDECKTNNCVENLEWCTHEYNLNYGTHNQRVAESMTNGKLSIPVDMLTKDGEFIRQFPSGMEAERWLRINGFPNANHSHINQCCRGKRNITYDHKWRYS